MKVNINLLKQNEDNPRQISDIKFEGLKKSILDFPEMLPIRPIVVNKDYVVLGGNMRLKALKELGYEEVYIEIMDIADKEYEFTIKDNLSYGEWNWESLEIDYTTNELTDWGLDVPIWYRAEEETKEIKKDETLETTKGYDKKTIYLFYSKLEKENIVSLLENYDYESTEEKFINIIKEYMDGN